MEIRFATREDGAPAEIAARRTASRAVAALRVGVDEVGVVVEPARHRRLWVDRCQAWLREHPDD